MNHKEEELKQQFLQEVNSNIQQIENFFYHLKIHQTLDIEEVNNAMRSAHSIKGGAAIMGLPVLSEFAHRWEDYLKVLKIERKTINIDDNLIELCLDAIDCLRQLLSAYADNLSLTAEVIAEQFQPIFDRLSEILGEPAPEDITTILATESNTHDAIALMFSTQIEFSLQHLRDLIATNAPHLDDELMNMAGEFEGLGQMFEIERFVQACESVMENLTTVSHADQIKNIAKAALALWRECQQAIITNNYQAIPITLNLEANLLDSDLLESDLAADSHHDQPEVTIPSFVPPINLSTETLVLEPQTTSKTIVPNETHIRISNQQVETITELSREVTINQHRLQFSLQQIYTLTQNFQQIIRKLDLAHSQTQRHWQKLSQNQPLPNSLQTTTTAIAQLKEIAIDIETHLQDTLSVERNLDKTTHNLQTRINQVSMRPLADILDRFPRALSELCQTYGKDVKIQIQGGDILMERIILDALNQPLTHLFRNAFDHGIETPQQRQSVGKPPQGTIAIIAQQQQSQTIITISDDGNGINLDRIRDRAIAMGLDSSLIHQASEADLLSLIFEPGFSTNDTVTELSGRGVGMDIVRNHLKQIQGEVKVDTQAGVGTTFTLTLPLQTSLIQVLLIESDRLMVAIAKSSVEAIVPYSPQEVYIISNKNYFKYKDTILPLIRLANCWQFNTQRTEISAHKTNPTISTPTVVIVTVNHQLIALQVERYWQEQEVILRPVEGNIPLPAGFSNATILRDGRVVPLLNPAELLYTMSEDKQQNSCSIQTTPPQNLIPPAQPSKPIILLVDDSVNVRRLLAHRLEQNGYRILEATNGLDALEQLQNIPQISAIISDIDMPQLDGYGLLEKLQLSSQLSAIPVLMLTSHNSDKYRQKAFNLGAKAYLKKPCNEHELLQSLSKIIQS